MRHPTFDGIPFAQSPVDELRFMPPVKSDAWDGILSATSIPRCLEAFEVGNETEIEGTEDCLYLSVYTPRNALETKSNLAVYLYFHGGAYAAGSSSLQDGAYIAATQNIVVVTANYRLGVFGFWFHPAFDGAYPDHDENSTESGNQGLLDQRMAKQWVKEHIGEFGGDIDRITICGMSAGGQSVQAHSVMPASQPYFDRVLSISGPGGVPYKNSTEAIDFYESIAPELVHVNHR